VCLRSSLKYLTPLEFKPQLHRDLIRTNFQE
jgi:hypothetical protein